MTTMRLHSLAAALLALVTLSRAVAEVVMPPAAPPPAGAVRTGRLDLPGGSLAGDLAPAPETAGGVRDTFFWQSPRFAAPLEFRVGDVSGITYPEPAQRPQQSGPFVHLRGGDVIAATIEALDAEALVVSIPGVDGPQRLRIARGEVAAISRSGAGGGSYVGPTGLAGWNQAPPGSWREEAGRIMSDKPGAVVSRDVAAPARARFDIRLSRRRPMEFRIAVASTEKPGDDGYVLQAIGDDAVGGLLLVRRSAGRAAIEPLPAAPWRGDALHVVLFVDQATGRFAAILPEAKGADAARVTEVTLPPAAADRPSGGFRLELTGGDVCLERLQVGAWLGAEPTLREPAETTVTTRTGGVDGFSVTSFDAAAGEYVLARGTETKRVAAGDVTEVRFPDPGDAVDDAAVRVVRADGGTLAGDLVKVDDRAVWLRRRGVDAAVAIPRDGIVAVRSQRQSAAREEPGGRVGTLVVGEDRLRGWLVAAAGGGLAWQPLGGVAAAPFAARPDAEVEYVARRPPKRGDVEVGGIGGLVQRDAEGFFIVSMMTDDGAAARDGRIQSGDRIVAIAPTPTSRFVETKDLDNETVTHLLRGRVGTVVRLKMTDGAGANQREIQLQRGPINVAGREILEQALQAHVRLAGAEDVADGAQGDFPALVVLRSGDVAPCRIETIDADAVRLASPLAGDPAVPIRVPAELVKAVELIPAAASRSIEKTLVDRLLMLPRMQRDRPPTHLLRLVDGDYLRGHLVKVDDKTVSFEVLDAVKQLPRAQVARVIWLHPDVPGPEDDAPVADEPEPEPAEEGLVVQGLAADERRMTLVAETVDGNSLRGHSRAFGKSAIIDLTQVDRLLIGAAVGRDGRELPFARWTLKPAPEPRALTKPDGK